MAENLKIRALTANDVELRVGKLTDKGASYLLYKNARVDMSILDEVCGTFGWQREHREMKGVMYCGVSIKSPDGEWITKWDAGAESYTEKEKGEASDSFKRACFNWGIGRELYTAPFIWITLTDEEKAKKGSGCFSVSNLQVVDGKITALEVVDKKGNVRFTMGKQVLPNKPVELKQPTPSAKKVTTPANDDIERQKQDLIVLVESAETVEQLNTLYDANKAIITADILAKFSLRKQQINNSKIA